MSARGFRRIAAARGTLWVAEGLESAARAAGLDRLDAWPDGGGSADDGAGRGRIRSVDLATGPRVVLKALRRGGVLAFLWRDRFLGLRRLRANLELPGRARALGVATPAAVALLEVPGPPGFYRGWLAVEELADTENLFEACRRSALAPDALDAALAAVRRMHDAGLDHPDLNLGNVLVREGRTGFEAFIVDLDRGRLGEGPLPNGRRRAALARLERSYLKAFGEGGPLGPRPCDRFFASYVGGDERLAGALGGRRTLARLALSIRRLGWRYRRPAGRTRSDETR